MAWWSAQLGEVDGLDDKAVGGFGVEGDEAGAGGEVLFDPGAGQSDAAASSDSYEVADVDGAVAVAVWGLLGRWHG